MNDLARPALYDAHHPLWPVRKPSAPRRYVADVVGPICESSDYMAKDRPLSGRPAAGDFLAVMMAGAYGFSMSSQYNARPRAAEVLVDGRRWRVARARETQADLVRGEKGNDSGPPFGEGGCGGGQREMSSDEKRLKD